MPGRHNDWPEEYELIDFFEVLPEYIPLPGETNERIGSTCFRLKDNGVELAVTFDPWHDDVFIQLIRNGKSHLDLVFFGSQTKIKLSKFKSGPIMTFSVASGATVTISKVPEIAVEMRVSE